MKAILVYDSAYGNTEQVAKAIAGSFAAGAIGVFKVREASYNDFEPVDLIIAGSPTNGGKMTPDLQLFFGKIPDTFVKGKKLATFDTRLKTKLVGIFGYAAPKLADILKGKGANLIAEPAGFYVKASKGPLLDGELERASEWGKNISKS